MSGELTRTAAGYDSARREVARLSALLAGRELELAETRLALSRFEALYYTRVGSLYVEIDRLRARLAEVRAKDLPDDSSFAAEARRFREEARRSAEEYARFADTPPPPDEKVGATAESRRLYRRIAARLHPDLARDDASRNARTRLMAELNDAYARGDVHAMEGILARWESSPEMVEGFGPEAERERLARVAARLREKIAEAEREIARLKGAPLHLLMVRVRDAERAGRDLLGELAEKIALKIGLLRKELADLAGGEEGDG